MKTMFYVGSIALVLSACSHMPSAYNGVKGFQVLQKEADSARLSYTLAARSNEALNQQKLQAACQKVLGKQKTYQIAIINVQEIANPRKLDDTYGIALPKTKATFALSNTPSLNNSEDMGTRQALESRPSSLNNVVYRCF